MDVRLIAQILQGEGGIIGPVGMYAVAGCLMTQLHADWLPHEIETAWYGREEPKQYAVYLAESINAGRVPVNGYLHCMSKQDVDKHVWDIGDLVVSVTDTPWQLHLYRNWPGD